MRVCEYGQQLDDPCNVKMDTEGCFATMGVEFNDGFTYIDQVQNTFEDFGLLDGGNVSVGDGGISMNVSRTSRDIVQITSISGLDDEDDDKEGNGSCGYGRPLWELLVITIFAWFL